MEYRISHDGAGQRLDKYVRKLLGDLPLSAIYKLIRTKKVRVNGARAEEAYLLKAGDVVTIREQALTHRPEKPAEKKPARKIEHQFEVLHEDAHILVLNKPSGLAMHPGTGITGPTLVDQVRDYLGEPPEGEFKPAPAHRLDKETSGVLIVAKTRQAIVKLAEIFTEQHPKKTYLTLVQGRVKASGIIDLPLAEHQQSSTSKQQRGVNLQSAVTRYRALGEGRDASLVEVEIETGRTHQIRRHFQAIEHPVVGDDKYGDFPFNRFAKAEWGVRRMFLHAARLALAHPVTGQQMTFRAPLPVELCEIVDKLGFTLPPKFPRADKKTAPTDGEG